VAFLSTAGDGFVYVFSNMKTHTVMYCIPSTARVFTAANRTIS